MPRKLPWATSTSNSSLHPPPQKRQRTTATTTTTAPKPPRTSFADTDYNEDNGPTYMLPSDECYIMVEDEFLSIAQTFTRSVHRAEYERLQSLAKAKNASRISEIQRPVPGVTRMSREMVLKAEIAAKQKVKEGVLKGLPPVGGEEDSSDEERVDRSVWGNSSLGMLMCSPKRRERDLNAKWKVLPGTRAAAGFVKAEVDGGVARRRLFAEKQRRKEREECAVGKPALTTRETVVKQEAVVVSETDDDEDDDDDDLDAPVIREASRVPSQSFSSTNKSFSTTNKSFASTQSRPSSQVPSTRTNTSHRSHTLPPLVSTSQPLPNLTRHPTAPLPRPPYSKPTLASPQPPLAKKPPPDFDFDFGLTSMQRTKSSYRGRSMAARKQAEREKSVLSSSPPRREGLLGVLFPAEE